MFRLAFWKKETGNYMSTSSGITEEGVKFLQDLKPGDRLVLFPYNRKTERDPHFTLKTWRPPQ